MAYVYRHKRLDKNEIFYIGIGSDSKGKYSRAYSKVGRNKYWHNITKSTEYKVEIISEEWLTWEEACEKEKFWITFYGRADLKKGSLVNMTDGGQVYPSNPMFGKDNPMFGNGHKLKGEKNGMYNKHHSDESKKKISEFKKGKPNIHIQGDKNPAKRLDVREKISKSRLGDLNVMKRPEVVEKLKETCKLKKESGYKRIYKSFRACPHCKVSGNGPNMTRYHFDNCKNKK